MLKKEFYISGGLYDKNKINNITNTLYHFTYVKYDIPFGKNNILTDALWGCMIRSYQNMLSMCLKYIYNGDELLNFIYKENGILSIQKFVKNLMNSSYEGKYMGSYFVSSIYKKIVNNENLKFKLYLSNNNIISLEKININKCGIICFSAKLGRFYVENKYINSIKECFKIRNFIGLLGGINKKAYFIYSLDNYDNLIYLDPHCINYYDKNFIKNKNKLLAKDYNSIKINKINPSIMFCFFFRNKFELHELKKTLENHYLFKIVDKEKKINLTNKEDNGWSII